MPDPDLTIHMPGDTGVSTDPQSDATKIAALEAENAQLRALVEHLQDGSAPAAPTATPRAPRLIGEDWSARTSADAKAAGVTKTVLCSDGYYVPPI